jgi:excisionase family DNA binding protein
MSTQPTEGSVLLDVAGAAAHLGVSEAFVRRLVLERRVRYFKVGKFVRFRSRDLDAFVEAGRRDPVEQWEPAVSIQRRAMPHVSAPGRRAAGQRGAGEARTTGRRP